MSETDLLVVFCTAAPSEAETLAGRLVEERLAACVNIAAVRSCYLLGGKLRRDDEALLIIKTSKSLLEPLKKRILEIHNYSPPEIIALPVVEGYLPYIEWAFAGVG